MMGTLLVGLGGTGFKTLSVIKERLVSLYGAVPPTIQLCCIDTESWESLNDRQRWSEGGSHSLLSESEFVWLGQSDLRPMIRALAVGRLDEGDLDPEPKDLSHVISWFQAHSYARRLRSEAWDGRSGGGQGRQLSRLALFRDLRNPRLSHFLRKMGRSVCEAATDRQLSVLLFGSTFGDTSSGLLVDVAYLVRQMAERATARLDAFLLLPDVLHGGSASAADSFRLAHAQSYALHRELERLTVGLHGHLYGFGIAYHSENPADRYQRRPTYSILLDNIYYINGDDGASRSLNRWPVAEGVIPLMAEAALALLQDTTSEREAHLVNLRTQTVAMGIVSDRNDYESIRFNPWGSVGAHSLVLPMDDIADSLSWRLVQEAALLVAGSDGLPHPLSSSAAGRGSGSVATDLFLGRTPQSSSHWNPYASKPGQDGEIAVGHSFPLLDDIRRLASDPHHKVEGNGPATVVNLLVDRSVEAWRFVLRLDDDPRAVAIQARMVSELGKSFITAAPGAAPLVPTSVRGQSAEQNWLRLRKQVEEQLAAILGSRDPGEGNTAGSLSANLVVLRDHLEMTFRERLRVMLLNILNDPLESPDDPGGNARQRRGPLAILDDFLQALHTRLDAYQQALHQAQVVRNPAGNGEELLQRRLEAVRAEGDHNPAPGLGGLGARRLRKRYLNAAQEVLDFYRLEQLEGTVLDLVGRFVAEVEQLRAQLQRWKESLVGAQSVRSRAEEARKRAEVRALGSANGISTIIWDEVYNDQLYTQYGGGAAAVPGLTRWAVATERLPQSGGLLELEWWGRKDGHFNRWRDVNEILAGLHGLASSRLQAAWQDESLPAYLARQDSTSSLNPAAVAELLVRNSGQALSTGAAGISSAFLLSPSPTSQEADAYLEALSEHLPSWIVPSRVVVKPTEDPFRLTMVRWVDLVPALNITSLYVARGDYEQVPGRYELPEGERPESDTRELLHVLPGEVQAVGIEGRLSSVNVVPPLRPRFLHHEVVHILENPSAFKAFVDAWSWGAITTLTRRIAEREVSVLGFRLPARVGPGTRVLAPEAEFWLTENSPSFMEALWNWYNESVKLAPDDTASPETVSTYAIQQVQALALQEREDAIQEWLTSHPEWEERLPDAERDRYYLMLRPDQSRVAELHACAELLTAWLHHLHRLEQDAASARVRSEQDALAAMMVLVDGEIRMARSRLARMLQV